MRCPCRKKSETATYADCCEPYHAARRVPATAEALMRSRYTAFVLEKAAYLRATWHASTRPARIDFTPGQEWVALRVVAARTVGNTATVEFVARSRIGGEAHVLHEVSRFAQDDGRWFYIDGTIK
jgi:SEC-C motif domain protein